MISQWAFAGTLLIIVLAATTQATSGFGFSLLMSPIFQLLGMGIDGVRLVNMLSLVINVVILAQMRRGVDYNKLAWLAIPAVAAIPAGSWLAKKIDGDALALPVAIIVLITIGASICRLSIPFLKGRPGAVLGGVLSGSMNTFSGVGGPVIAAYVANADWPRRIAVPTVQAYFLVINAGAVVALGFPSYGPSDLSLYLGAASVGLILGGVVSRKLPEGGFRATVLVLAAVGAIISICRYVYLSW